MYINDNTHVLHTLSKIDSQSSESMFTGEFIYAMLLTVDLVVFSSHPKIMHIELLHALVLNRYQLFYECFKLLQDDRFRMLCTLSSFTIGLLHLFHTSIKLFFLLCL